MSRFTPSSIERVRRDAPIHDVLSPMGTIKRSGRKEIMRCFVHDDKHPSLQIDPVRNTCKCRACDWGGDVIDAYIKVQQLNGRPVDFPTAVRALADQYHIPIEEVPTDPKYREAAVAAKIHSDHAFSLHQYVADYYHDQLHITIGPSGAKTTAHAYFTARGLTQATIDAFHLGGVPHTSQAFVDTLIGQGYTPDELTQYTLFRQDRNHDWQSVIHDRVVYPIQNHMGRIVGFAGRLLPNPQHPEADKGRKYINSAASDIYHKHELLYGLYQAKDTIRKHDRCYIVEGYQDVLAMHQASLTETIAVCGVALCEQQVRHLQRFTDQITLMLDGDKAGQKAMLSHLEVLLTRGCYVSICILPDNQDPDDYLRDSPDASRSELLTSLAHHTQDWLTHFCHLLAPLNGKPLRQAQEKLFQLISVMPDKVRQEGAIRQAAKLLNISYDIATYEIQEQAKKTQQNSSPKRGEVARSDGVVGKKHPAQFLVPKSGEVPQRGGVVGKKHPGQVLVPKSGEVPQRGGVVDSKMTVPDSKKDPKQPAFTSKHQQTEKTILRHLVLYGTYRITPDDPTTSIVK